MIRNTLALLAAMAVIGTAPAMAKSSHHQYQKKHSYQRNHQKNHARKQVRSPKAKSSAKAYQQGYRDGSRANQRQIYVTPSRQQQVRYRSAAPAYSTYPASYGAPYWWGSNGRIHCRRNDGTTGLLIGAVAGGTLGNVIANHGDKTLGTVIGGALGGMIGREIDRGNAQCR